MAYGDIEEISVRGHIMRDVRLKIDPFRLAYANKMPLGAMYRRELIEPLGGWTDPDPEVPGYEDSDLWMTLAEAGVRGRHLGRGTAAYGYRIQIHRLTTTTRRSHPRLYQARRERRQQLFGQSTRTAPARTSGGCESPLSARLRRPAAVPMSGRSSGPSTGSAPDRRPALGGPVAPRPLILAYHSLADLPRNQDPHWLAVSPDRFRRQVERLRSAAIASPSSARSAR